MNILRKKLVLFLGIFMMNLVLIGTTQTTATAAPIYQNLGMVTNSTTPSNWLGFTFDITALVSGATNAQLTFDLRNDAPNPPYPPDSTTSQVLFGIDNSNLYYFVHFDYMSGADTSHWRNVELLIDGLRYIDQYGSFNNHLGDDFVGTAAQGTWGTWNILGQTGYDASTYNMTIASSVPEPNAIWLIGFGLLGLIVMRKKLLSWS